MSRDELSRLVGDVMGNSTMIQEAMTIQDQATMEGYITSKGYDLTKDEMLEVWSMTAKVMAGHSMPMTDVQSNIRVIKSEARAAQK